jgi:hypothetical protein
MAAFNNSSDGISSKALTQAFQDVDGQMDLLFKESNTSMSTLIFIKKVGFCANILDTRSETRYKHPDYLHIRSGKTRIYQ